MHIIIGAITAIAGLIWALNALQNSGFNLNSLNPFYWMRRRKWEKKLGTKPMHALTDPMEAAALLVVAVARALGDISRETKNEILNLFTTEFNISMEKAIEVYNSSVYLLKDAGQMSSEVKHILAPTKADFTQPQIESLVQMLEQSATLEDKKTYDQEAVIQAVKREFAFSNS